MVYFQLYGTFQFFQRNVEIENNKVKIMINMFGSETAAELELYQIAEL